jgi:hypothetical protein
MAAQQAQLPTQSAAFSTRPYAAATLRVGLAPATSQNTLLWSQTLPGSSSAAPASPQLRASWSGAQYSWHASPLPQAAAAGGGGCGAEDGRSLWLPASAEEAAAVTAALVGPQRRWWLGLRQADLAAGAGGNVSVALPGPAPQPSAGAVAFRWSGGAVSDGSGFDAFAAGAPAAAAAGGACAQLDVLSGRWHPAPCDGTAPGSVASFACQARAAPPATAVWSAGVGGLRFAWVTLPEAEAAAVTLSGAAASTPASLCAAHRMAPAALPDAATRGALQRALAPASAFWLGYAAQPASAAPPASWSDGAGLGFAPSPVNAADAAAAAPANASAGDGDAFCGVMAPAALPDTGASGGAWLLARCGAAAASPLCASAGLAGLTWPPGLVAAPPVNVSVALPSGQPGSAAVVSSRQSWAVFSRWGAASEAVGYAAAQARCQALGGNLAVWDGGPAALAPLAAWHGAALGSVWLGLR